jgi:hypothetical protein
MAPSTRLAVALVMAGMALLPGAGTPQQESDLAPESLAQAIPRFAFQLQGNRPALVFSHSGAGEHDPRILVSSRDGWRLIQFSETFHNLSWVYAGRGATSDEVWAAAQAGGEGPRLELASSANGGRNWRYRGSMQKISPQAAIDYLAISPAGKGTLVLRLDQDPSPNAPRLGYYLYMTKNGGRDWSQPFYSQGKPSPASDVLAPPDRTFEPNQPPLATDAWQRLLAELLPGG